MKVLIACEFSGIVREAFKKRGHDAWSCDLLDTEILGNHIKGDVLELINNNWDLIIAHPPCTHLAVSGAKHFRIKREDGRQKDAIEFFMKMISANCEKICVENPVNIISGNYIKKWFPNLCKRYNLPLKPTQYIQPYEYGDKARKKTALWLKGLPKLKPTKIVDYGKIDKNGHSYGANSTYAKDKDGKILSWNDPRTAMERSRTFKGIAEAMAEQWG